MSTAQSLGKKITDKKAVVGIIGMGYVGQAISDLIRKNKFQTIGFVRSTSRLSSPRTRGSRSAKRKTLDSWFASRNDRVKLTTNTALIQACDVILMCVQTPIDENQSPNLGYIKKAAEQITANLRKGQLVIIESSISVGTTRNVVLPILNQSPLKAGEDFFLAFSPERVDPGNTKLSLNEIPKVVAGLEENSRQLAVTFYKTIIDHVVPVSSLETAELVKLFENTFRLVNISLVNELETYAKTKNINVWEVISAAASKPFGFLAHYPSPGAGGHCIPVDPFYLLDDAKMNGVPLKLVEEAAKINTAQPKKIVKRALEILAQGETYQGDFVEEFFPRSYLTQAHYEKTYSYTFAGAKGGRSYKNSDVPLYNILLLGLAYKPDIDDLRESPALKIWKQLEELGFLVSYHDPYIPSYKQHTSQNLTSALIQKQDLIIVTTNHSKINYKKLAEYGKPILDTRNVYDSNTASYIYTL